MSKPDILVLWMRVCELQPHLRKLVQGSQSLDKELQDIESSQLNPDEYQLFEAMYRIEQEFFRIHREIAYLNKEISYTGRLSKRTDGRYGLKDGDYFTSGDPIEVLIDNNDRQYWITSRVEHNETDYYIVDAPDLSMEGLYVRKRDRAN